MYISFAEPKFDIDSHVRHVPPGPNSAPTPVPTSHLHGVVALLTRLGIWKKRRGHPHRVYSLKSLSKGSKGFDCSKITEQGNYSG